MFSTFRKKDFVLLSDSNEVVIGGQREKLTPKEMGVLEILYSRSGTTVTRKELLESVWGVRFVNDQGLTQAVSRIRGILSKSTGLTIVTIPKKGYQLRRQSYLQNRSASSWIRTHPKLLTLTFICLILWILILTDKINIEVTKDSSAQDNAFSGKFDFD